jgi:hypothetical protein
MSQIQQYDANTIRVALTKHHHYLHEHTIKLLVKRLLSRQARGEDITHFFQGR